MVYHVVCYILNVVLRVSLFVEPVDVFWNQSFHNGPFRLQDLPGEHKQCIFG